MKKYLKIIITFCLVVAGFNILIKACIAQTMSLDATLNEKVVMIAADSGTPGPTSVAFTRTASSGSSPSVAPPHLANADASNDSRAMLETTIFKPPGAGPFPILIMNHGKSPGNPHLEKRARFIVLSKEFVQRGYAVIIPMRTGFSKSTGRYIEEACNMTANGHIQAHDLQRVLDYTLQQSWADKNRILIAGQSYGGLTTMAFDTRTFPGIKGLINFAGGLRTKGDYCQWQASLIDAFSEYGSKATVPSIWFYGENDSYFNPALATKLHTAYVKAGGNATLVAYGAFKKDAHGMSSHRDGVKIWWPEVEAFLQKIGMPTETIFPFPPKIKIPTTNFAVIDNVDAVPYLQQNGREEYHAFLSKSLPRAFAISTAGAWSWEEGGDDPAQNVLANCTKISRLPCKLYAVDDAVVWAY